MIIKRSKELLLSNTADAAIALLQIGASGFPSQVNVQPGVAVEGDFADTNYRSTAQAGQGALIAGPLGVIVGRWAWVTYRTADDMNAPGTANNSFGGFGSALPTGFVHREQQGLIVTYLQAAGMTVQPGFPVTLFNAGGFFVLNRGLTQALPGQYAYANFADGSTFFGAGTQAGIGSASLGGGVTLNGSFGPQAASFTGSISGSTLTVTALASGTIAVGGTVAGTAGVVAGTQIVAQLSGTPGGVGVYAVGTTEQTVLSSPMTLAYGLLTCGTLSAGTLGVGVLLTGTGGSVIAGTVITALGTGAGGTGTYIVNATQTLAAQAMSGQTNVQTKFIATTAGNANELVKMTSSIYG